MSKPTGGAVADAAALVPLVPPPLSSAVMSLGKQTATLILGAVAFSVAMSWNAWVQSLIDLYTPKEKDGKAATVVQYNLWASLALTVLAVALSWVLTFMYGKSVASGQAESYGLT